MEPAVRGAFVIVVSACCAGVHAQPGSQAGFHPDIPKTWEDAAIPTLEIPLANPIGSPKHVSSAYYYKVPVRPIYKSYPIYAPGHEPSGYMDWLKQQEPQIIWDDSGHRPQLQTEADWIKAGEMVFDAAIDYQGLRAVVTTADARDPSWWAGVGAQAAKDGTLPGYRYVIRKQGQIEVGGLSCASCHTRLMPEGAVIKGAQGNSPFDRALGLIFRSRAVRDVRLGNYRLYGTPWLNPDPQARLLEMSLDEIASAHEAIPSGVQARHRSSLFYPVQVPDLIGVRDRHYLDHTGLQQHRGIVDLMRYAALNQGADDFASFDGFVPDGPPDFKTLPAPDKLDPLRTQADRYSDEQLYALALYVYSLNPPPNPNKFDAVAAQGQKIFQRERCATCHTPPLYTNNRLTLADDFHPNAAMMKQFDVMPVSVGTDPHLALETRKGTGFYRVPSLRMLWLYRCFLHDGSVGTLEELFNSERLKPEFHSSNWSAATPAHAVKGHPFGLDLSAEDRSALIAFLRTL